LGEHCPKCGVRRSEWQDDDGKELRDAPFELVEQVCPPCAAIEEWREETGNKKSAPKGIYPAFRRLPDEG
jgi:hypothetical protein